MKRYLVILLLAAITMAVPAAADTVSLSGSNSATAMVGGGTIAFGNNTCYNGYCGNWGPIYPGVTTFGSAQMTVPLGVLSLPSGATLTSAVLSWNTTGAFGASGVPATRSESDSQYYAYTYYYSYSCGWGSRCYGSYPVYYSGYGGTAAIQDSANYGSTQLTFGNSNVLMLSPSGSLDLLAAGYGADLLSGAMTFSASGSSSLWATVSNTGYYATTFYYPSLVGNTFDTSATLDVTYSLPLASPAGGPAPLPEPASLVLFGSGLAGVASILRRKRA